MRWWSSRFVRAGRPPKASSWTRYASDLRRRSGPNARGGSDLYLMRQIERSSTLFIVPMRATSASTAEASTLVIFARATAQPFFLLAERPALAEPDMIR